MGPFSSTAQAETRYPFISGEVCLDFANTVGGIRGGRTYEGLTSYVDLVRWSQQANLVTESEAEMLVRKAEHDGEAVAAVLRRACVLREAIYSIFIALIADTQPASSDLETLNKELRKGTTGASLILTPDGFEWEWGKKQDALDQMLAPLARSAATLLISAQRRLVRQCANERCGWLFVDTTKNHRRQWCTTEVCGSNVRVRRYRERLREERASGKDE